MARRIEMDEARSSVGQIERPAAEPGRRSYWIHPDETRFEALQFSRIAAAS